MPTVDVLDLTTTPEDQQAATLLAALDGLAAGSTLEVRSGAHWNHLLAALQEGRWGLFDWRPLEMGPDDPWIAELARLQPSAKNNTLFDFLTRDHHRCDTLFAATENAAHEEDTAAMSRLCRRFLVAMEHHFRMEEDAFFPTFEEKTGMRQGPTMVMRSEHDQMRNLMAQMGQAATAGDADLLLKAGGTLMFLMQQHNVKEEQMLYPMADSHLQADIEPLLKKMQRICEAT